MSKASNVIQMIPIDTIHILNPRVRNQKVFDGIVHNIVQVGLKRPITVTNSSSAPGKEYDLVCGQGRLEAFMACGQTEIPAIIIDASEEDALVMSLVENCARRQHRAVDLMRAIEILQKQGYEHKEIAAKVGLGVDYTRSVLHLFNNGEERLLHAVETGKMAISVAVNIANAPNAEVQQALQDAYDSKLLRGNKLIEAKRLVELRRKSGKTLAYNRREKGHAKKMTGFDVVKVYQKEVDRKRLLTRKAEFANSKVVFVVEALSQIFQEKGFQALLQTEALATLPKQLSDLIKAKV
jgi:ParB family chromosome partitioning protein